jgi:hypothetical protein
MEKRKFISIWKIIKNPIVLSLAYFVVMTIVMTWPAVVRMGDSVIGQIGDNIYFVWLVHWYQEAIFGLGISPFFDPLLNYPDGWSLASTDTTPAMVALALPGSLLFGETWGYNFSMLLSFVLSGWGMYLWVRHFTQDDASGLIAGTLFAFIPYRILHYLAGHLSLMGTQWFPFYFWGLADLLNQEGFSWKPVLQAAIFAGLIGLTSPYYLFMTTIISVIFFAGWMILGGWRRWRSTVLWKSLLTFGFLSVLLLAIAMAPYLNLNSGEGLVSWSLEYVSKFSASPTDFVIPSASHFLWGEWIRTTLNRKGMVENTLYLSAVAVVLGFIGWLKRKSTKYGALLSLSAITAIAAFILALGIEPYWMGKKMVSVPTLLQPIVGTSSMPQIYLPSYFLYLYLPFFAKMRAILRFGLFTILFVTFMAGMGVKVIRSVVRPRYQRLLVAGILVLALIDLYPGVFNKFSRIEARPVDYWLASQPNSGAVAQLPVVQMADQDQVYNTIIHRKAYVGGFFNANTPKQFTRISPVLGTFPSRESVDLLRELGVSYIIVDSTQYADFSSIDATAQSLGLMLLNVSENQYVYGFP